MHNGKLDFRCIVEGGFLAKWFTGNTYLAVVLTRFIMTQEDRIYANQKYQEIVFLLTIFNLVRNKQYIRLSETKGYCILTYPLILFKIKIQI